MNEQNLAYGFVASGITAMVIISAGILIRKGARRKIPFVAVIPLCILMLFLANLGSVLIGATRLGFIDIISILIFGRILRWNEDSQHHKCDVKRPPIVVNTLGAHASTKAILDTPMPPANDNATQLKAANSDSKPCDTESSFPKLRMNGLFNLKTAIVALAALGCLLGLAIMPDDYYKVLRFVVVAACVAVILDIHKSVASEKKKTVVSVLFGLIAVIFNPFLPLEMDRGTWAWFDLGAFGLLASRIVSLRLVGGVWKTQKATLITISLALCAGIFFVFGVPAVTRYLSFQKQVSKWEAEAEKSDFHMFRLGYNDPAFVKYLLKGDPDFAKSIYPENSMHRWWNREFLNWVSRGEIEATEYREQSDKLQKEFFSKWIGEDELFVRIREAINSSENGIVWVGKKFFDAADVVAFPKGVRATEDESEIARAHAIALMQTGSSNQSR